MKIELNNQSNKFNNDININKPLENENKIEYKIKEKINNKDIDKQIDTNIFQLANYNYIENLDKFDKFLSKKIHDTKLPKITEYMVYMFARIFNPDLITSYLVIIFSYKSINNEPYFILTPIISTIGSLVISIALKKYIKRLRPEPSKISSRIYD